MITKDTSFVNKIIFPAPESSYDSAAFPNQLVWLPTTRGSWKHFPCIFIESKGDPRVMLYSHGNAEDIGLCYELFDAYARKLGINVLLIEYPGYGPAPDALPCESGCVEHINAAYKFLVELGFDPKNVIIFGRSIGTGPSVELAARLAEQHINVGALVLQSPYTSIKRLAKELVGWPHVFLSERFNNFDRIKTVKSPTLIVHGVLDNVIPLHHGKALYE
eukprot:Colp12_sorted_trinity150504_noHs@25901